MDWWMIPVGYLVLSVLVVLAWARAGRGRSEQVRVADEQARAALAERRERSMS